MSRDGQDHWRPDAPKRRWTLGLWSSAIFHICLVVIPIAGAKAVSVVMGDKLYTYEATDSAKQQTRAALDALAEGILTTHDRRLEWDNKVAAALMAGDIAGARGLMLFSPNIVDPQGRTQILRDAGGASDAEIESGALNLLTPGTRARYATSVPLLARQTSAQSMVRPRAGAYVAGDVADFEAAAVADIENPQADHLRFVLMSQPIIRAGQMSPDALTGTAVLTAALNANAVRPEFRDALSALAEAALPRTRFREEAARRGVALQERGQALDAAYRATLTRDAVAAFDSALARIGKMGADAGGPGAINLLRHARRLDDLSKLGLIAATNPDRGAALARALPLSGALPLAGRGALDITPEFAIPAVIALIALLLIAFTALMTAAQAVAHALENVGIVRPEEQAPRPKRGAKLIREFQR
ncbi:MAG: hypothetical protein ABW199_10585 [Caulobacterales bacterium]